MTTPSNIYVFAFNGWLFGGVDGAGVQVLSVDGLEDLPTLRTQDEGRGYSDGMFTGNDFLNGRTITMQLQIMGAGAGAGSDMQTYLQQLKQYLTSQTSGTGVLQIYLPSRGVQRLNARVRARAIRIDPNYTYGRAECTVQFFCPDPRIYNDTASTFPFANLPNRVRSYDKTYNYVYSAIGSSINSYTVTNAGNYETWATFTISGTCTAPVITNNTTGQFLSFPNLTMGASDTLVISSDLRTVLLNGTAARNLLSATSSWFSLPSNTATTITYSISTGTAGCIMTYRDAYI